MGRVDVALEEYKQLRAEILAPTQAQTTVVSIALTATAAIAGVAFSAGGKDDSERLEILLALPLVLTGLGLTYLAHGVNSIAIGRYIGERLWPALAAASRDRAAVRDARDHRRPWGSARHGDRGVARRPTVLTAL